MIVVVDYGMCNVGSITNMLRKVGAQPVASADPAVIAKATKLVLPGVGAFANGMRRLEEAGLVELLNRKVLEEKTPILGLCLGMQLFTLRSEEGSAAGLGWIDADTVKFSFPAGQEAPRVPHMGWNAVQITRPNALWAGMHDDPLFYFVHSYHVVCRADSDVATTTRYGYTFTSAVVHGHIAGTQFHPEKSHKFGTRLFANFVERF
jgi:imidazole glycerol-phosphate synthase subunit HisH